jgi:mono/diheme cytochrome c family protein
MPFKTVLFFAIAWTAAVTAGSQGAGQSGREADARLFRTYCASCHGTTGRGDGPVAEELRKTPPDLTRYAARNGGVFPSEHLRLVIDGREVAAHGTRDMPVWGDAFRQTAEGLSADEVKARIDAIVRFLEGIQARTAQ